jgi:flagellar FliL protein
MTRFNLAMLLSIVVAGICSTAVAEPGSDGATGNPYLELNPAFTVNVGEPGARVSFAKVDITLRLQGENDKERVSHHRPGIRDIVVSLLSNQPLDKVENGEGREALRAEALKSIQAYFEREEGKALVSDLLFTSFVVQR